MSNLITGVLPALVTPLDEQGNVKTELAKPLIDMYAKQEADGVYMLGWTGEGEHLSVEQRKLWAEAVLEAAKDVMPVFVHVGYNQNLDDSVELAAHAEANGAYAVASVGISAEATFEENVAYFKRISEAAPNTPFYIYWIASGSTLTGGRNISPDFFLKAMEDVPTFKGIKFTDIDFYTLERFKKYQPDVNILTGADELAVCSMLMGADGNIGALQAITCYHHKMMYNKIMEGDYIAAKELQFRANEVAEVYKKSYVQNLPAIKLVLDKVYGIPVGICSPHGPFAGHVISPEAEKELIDVFKKNILVAE